MGFESGRLRVDGGGSGDHGGGPPSAPPPLPDIHYDMEARVRLYVVIRIVYYEDGSKTFHLYQEPPHGSAGTRYAFPPLPVGEIVRNCLPNGLFTSMVAAQIMQMAWMRKDRIDRTKDNVFRWRAQYLIAQLNSNFIRGVEYFWQQDVERLF